MIRVLLADDHHLVRKGIRTLLEAVSGIEVVGEAVDGQEAIDLAEALAPDVLVIDISMPCVDGLQAAAEIHARDGPTRIIVLSMYSDRALVRRARRAGACGYVLKQSVTKELLDAVAAAYRGETYLSAKLSDGAASAFYDEGAGGR